MRFNRTRHATLAAQTMAAPSGVPPEARVLAPGERLAWLDLPLQTCFVIPLAAEPAPAGTG